MRKLQLAIPKPCRESWDAMEGGAESRFCESCGKAVHDLSQMTARELRKLVRSSPGGVCGRIMRDERGEILLRREAEGNTFGRLVGISLLGASALAAQTQGEGASCRLEVRVADPTGAVIPKATVRVAHGRKWEAGRNGMTDNSGIASLDLPAGEYDIRAEAAGFASAEVAAVKYDATKTVRMDVRPMVATTGEVVVVTGNPSIFRRLKNLF